MSKKTKLTKPELAKQLNLSTRQIEKYIFRGMPRNSDGTFILDAVQEWRAKNIRPRIRASKEFNYWKTVLAREQTKLLKLQRRISLGELVEVDVIAREAERKISTAKALLEQIPDRVLDLLPKKIGAEPRKNLLRKMRKVIENTCYALAEGPKNLADELRRKK